MTKNSKSQLLLALLCLSALSVFGDSGAGVKLKVIQGPDSLTRDLTSSTNIELSLGNFGYVPFGKSITGKVYPTEPANACEPIKPIVMDDDDTSAPILLIDRGDCTFVTKVSNARAQGARMVIIVNKVPGSVGVIEMVEDNTGLGKTLDIPTVMIGKTDGDKIQKAVNEFYDDLKNSKALRDRAHPVMIHAKFPWNKKDKANVEMWLSPGNAKAMDFVSDFKWKGQRVLEQSNLDARYAVWRCNSCQQADGTWPDRDMDNCLGGGRYCQPDPDDDGKQTGADMLKETLRQLCIRNFYNTKVAGVSTGTEMDKFFAYIQYFNSTCVKSMLFTKDVDIKKNLDMHACSKQAMKAAGIDDQKIHSCTESSWKGCHSTGRCYNQLLEPEYELFTKRAIAVWPAVIINNQTFKGNLIPEEVTNFVCTAFTLENVPQECKKYVVDPYKVNDNADYYEGGNFWSTFFWVLFFLAIIMVLFFYYYRRYVRRAMVDEMNDQIQSAVATYFKMGDNKGSNA